MNRHRQDVPAAQADALARMFKCWPDGRLVRDGRDTVLEAMDDADFRKAIAKHMESGSEDDAELGRMVRERLIAYAQACPCFEDYTDQALADQQDRSDEDEARDAEIDA